MGNFILIAGQTGAGKTTGIRTLNPKETVVLRTIKRVLPFKDAKKFIVKDTSEYSDVLKWIDKINSKASIKNIVITDGTYIMRHEFFKRDKETGYGKFTDIANHMREVILKIQDCREDLNVFMEYHVETIQSDGSNTGYKAATVGKLLDEKYNIFENVDVILFAEPKVVGNSVEYGYYTNLVQGKGGAYLPAKSPMGMFDDIFIPNDLQIVADTIKKYYTDETTENETVEES